MVSVGRCVERRGDGWEEGARPGLWSRGARARELGARAAGDVPGFGEEVAHSDLRGIRFSIITPCTKKMQHGAFRVQSSRAGPSPILSLLHFGRARSILTPALTSSLVRKGGGGKVPETKDACATVTFPPESGGNSLRSVRVRAEALRVSFV